MCLCFMVSTTHAEGISVQPKISKYDASTLFSGNKQFEQRELVVRFASDVSSDERKTILQHVHGREVSFFAEGNFSLVRIPAGAALQNAADQLLKNKQVVYAEPNYQMKRDLIPTDPGYKKQWYLSKIQLPQAWDQTKGSANLTVAVIDDGVDQNQPELKGRIVYPYNAVTGSNAYIPHNHATHVAGIIAAAMDNTGITGIAPNVKIMPINVFNGEDADADVVAKAIKYAVDHHADVINLSLGSSDYSNLMDYYAQYAKSKGVVLVAAAGNYLSNIPVYPAALPAVIGVSATDQDDQFAVFSNYGSDIDLSAPGLDIYSTAVNGNGYVLMSGTSMAAPIVSGVAALIRSKNPLLSPEQVEAILKKSAHDLGKKGWDPYYGYGRVDAYKAVASTPRKILTVTSPTAFSMTGTSKAAVSITASGGKSISVYIQNSSGKLMKSLIKNQSWKSSAVHTSWDGKMDNGKFASSGNYKVTVKVTNGKDNFYQTGLMKVTNNTVPSITTTGTAFYFSPVVYKNIAIPFRLNKSAKVTATVYTSSGKKVRTVLNNQSLSTGSHSVTWNGQSSQGTHMKDGTYQLLMSVIDSRKVRGKSRKLQINIDTVKPTGQITLSSTLFKMDSQNHNQASVKWKEPVYLTAYVINDKGQKVRRLMNGTKFNAGSGSLSWDGIDDQHQLVNEGRYYYDVEVRDLAGNQATVKSNWFALQDWYPPTIDSVNHLLLNTKGTLTIGYTLSKPSNVTIGIYNGTVLMKAIQSGIPEPAGEQYFFWNGTDEYGVLLADGDYQFVINAVNKYQVSQTFTGQIQVRFNNPTE